MSSAPSRILVVDDEPRIVEVVSAYLARDGHEVASASDGNEALEVAARFDPDLLVLDLMLPGRSGFDVLRELRAAGSRAAVIILTARDDLVDRVAGLELGADDYVVKPFEPRELTARVGAVLRRVERQNGVERTTGAERPAGTVATADASSGEAGAGAGVANRLFDLEIDPPARLVRRGTQSIELTRAEFDLLAALVAERGLVLSREQLGERIFGEAFTAFDRTIDSHVKNLRHKLGARPDGGAYVETVRGVGYRAPREASPVRGPGPDLRQASPAPEEAAE